MAKKYNEVKVKWERSLNVKGGTEIFEAKRGVHK